MNLLNHLVLISIAFASAAFLCAPDASAYVLERENMRLFSIMEKPAVHTGKMSGKKLFRIRGMQDGSLGVCGKPITHFRNGTLSVKIPKRIFSNGLGTGPFFDVTVKALANLEKIVFGTRRQEIWPDDKAQKILTADEAKALSIAREELLKEFPQADLNEFSPVVHRSGNELSAFSVSLSEWKNGSPDKDHRYRVDGSGKVFKYPDDR